MVTTEANFRFSPVSELYGLTVEDIEVVEVQNHRDTEGNDHTERTPVVSDVSVESVVRWTRQRRQADKRMGLRLSPYPFSIRCAE